MGKVQIRREGSALPTTQSLKPRNSSLTSIIWGRAVFTWRTFHIPSLICLIFIDSWTLSGTKSLHLQVEEWVPQGEVNFLRTHKWMERRKEIPVRGPRWPV